MAETYELPMASVSRIMKAAIPKNIQVAKEVKQSFAKAAGLFILYLTSTANDFCKQARRQTVSATDVLNAVEELEFDEFLEPLQQFLSAYRKQQQAKKKRKAEDKPKAPSKKAKKDDDNDNDNDDENDNDNDNDDNDNDNDNDNENGDEDNVEEVVEEEAGEEDNNAMVDDEEQKEEGKTGKQQLAEDEIFDPVEQEREHEQESETMTEQPAAQEPTN
mmetsp:Transcript_26644/g.52503  ORF Transcript_26644/g.52503 Transcript_26644/m.52503 type:complete len:218 (+) Transcript_26644:24-677(+)